MSAGYLPRMTDDQRRWKVVGRAEYQDGNRAEFFKQWDSIYGKGDWRVAWGYSGRTVGFDELALIVSESYFKFLSDHLDMVQKAKDLAARLAPSEGAAQEQLLRGERDAKDPGLRALQAAALRRTLAQDFALDIDEAKAEAICRSPELGRALSPSTVPFHEPGRIIINPRGSEQDSIESFYRSNRVLEVERDALVEIAKRAERGPTRR
ncbi:MAG TPA: hypothetical protein VL944_01375 [Candidatus Acidoferrum sp.]|nr:hypothetical protein [Candidatus Acidoferrum sp.]